MAARRSEAKWDEHGAPASEMWFCMGNTPWRELSIWLLAKSIQLPMSPPEDLGEELEMLDRASVQNVASCNRQRRIGTQKSSRSSLLMIDRANLVQAAMQGPRLKNSMVRN